MSHLRLDGVRKSFDQHVAVDDVSLSIEEGELLVLLGPSGCGKSTTLNMVAGFLRPDGGDISIDGLSLVNVPVHKRNIGVVFQSYSLFPHMTVRENTAFGLKRRRLPDADIRAKVAQALALVGMEKYADRYPDQLSGGQQQRVAIARALVIEPRVLLLDEPLSNLDAKLRVDMRDQIRSLVTRTGVTTIFVTHDQEEALTVADRVGVMHEGRLLQLAPPREIYHRPADLTVAGFVGRSNMLRGHVVGTEADIGIIKTDDDVLIRGRTASGLQVGASAMAVVRPEAIQVVDAGVTSHSNRIEAVLTAESFLGQSLELHFDAFGGMTVLTNDRSNLAVGQVCQLAWGADETALFPADG